MAFKDGFNKCSADWAGVAKNVGAASQQVGKGALGWAAKNPGKAMAGSALLGAGAAKAMGGQQKTAEEDTHQIRRALVGNPISAAIGAKKGHKWKAFKGAYGHALKETLKGEGKGAIGGAAAGAAGGAIHHAIKGGGKLHGAGKGAIVGALAGGIGGGYYGIMKGNHGAEATRLHQKYHK